MNPESLQTEGLILLEAISGSRAYGLSTPKSDTDIRGIFYLPENKFFGLDYTEQVNDANNDIIFYELRRIFELLAKNNPNILELIAMPEDCILKRDPILDSLTPELFLSKLCNDTFVGYARAQIYKARGLNKKVVNPMEKERKSPLDFCFVPEGQGSVPVKTWLARNGWNQENCGLVNIPHMRDIFALFYDPNGQFGYTGIVKNEAASNTVSLSSVPKSENPVAIMAYNKDGYSVYCKDYKSYWEWVENRNEHRYQQNLENDKNYDTKNMMHTFRLLSMAEEIAREGIIAVRRPNRDFLLSIRFGEHSYDSLLDQATDKIAQLDELFAQSDLPESPDLERINQLLVNIRQTIYSERKAS